MGVRLCLSNGGDVSIILRGSIPDWMSMVLSNTLVIGGAILGYMGLGRFVGKKISQVHNYVLLAAFPWVHAYFTLVQSDQAARNINVSLGLLIICLQCTWLLLYRVERCTRRLTRGGHGIPGVHDEAIYRPGGRRTHPVGSGPRETSHSFPLIPWAKKFLEP